MDVQGRLFSKHSIHFGFNPPPEDATENELFFLTLHAVFQQLFFKMEKQTILLEHFYGFVNFNYKEKRNIGKI
jgi:hypothetical protein